MGPGRSALEPSRNFTNFLTALIGFGVTFGISFFLTPYIVRTLGVEANGYLKLTETFLSYAVVLTIIVTSMAARFATVAIRQERHETATEYYTAAYMGTLLVSAVVLPVMVLTIVRSSVWFDVPPALTSDVALLMSLVFVNFLLPLVLPRWGVGFWATNALYLDSIGELAYSAIRGLLILLLFIFLPPNLYLVGISVLAAGIFKNTYNGLMKRRLLPDVRVDWNHLRWDRVSELMRAGAWNSVSRMSVLLSGGLELLLAGIFVGATGLGILALAKTVPQMLTHLGINLHKVFLPRLTFAFTDGDFAQMRLQAGRAIRVLGLIISMGFAALVVQGQQFFLLWVPTENAHVLYVLAIISSIALLVNASTDVLLNIFVAANELRRHSIAVLAVSAANPIVAIILLTTTDLGLYAIVGTSTATQLLRSLLVTIPMAGRVCRSTASTFFRPLPRLLLNFGVYVLIGFAIGMLFPSVSWLSFFSVVALMCLIGGLINLRFFTHPSDNAILQTFIKAQLVKRGWK